MQAHLATAECNYGYIVTFFLWAIFNLCSLFDCAPFKFCPLYVQYLNCVPYIGAHSFIDLVFFTYAIIHSFI